MKYLICLYLLFLPQDFQIKATMGSEDDRRRSTSTTTTTTTMENDDGGGGAGGGIKIKHTYKKKTDT